jgi:DNA/RNA-binding domain of Phe-tRNA-synthetase-like protein
MVKLPGSFPPEVEYKLAGWDLMWIELTTEAKVPGLSELHKALPGRLKRILLGRPLAEHPVVQSVRGLFRNSGCDPTRHRPSSEALVRRLEKGQPLPAILPAVDLNNLLSVELLVPCCVIEPSSVTGPMTLRRGRPGELMESMRGPFTLDSKPVLADADGPFGTPITDNEKVKVKKAKGTFWMVVYLPRATVTRDRAVEVLNQIMTGLSGATWNAGPS